MRIFGKHTVRNVSCVIAMAMAACILFALPISCKSCSPTDFFAVGALKAQGARKRLLCRTDHKALVDAGRKLLAQATKNDLKPTRYNVRDYERSPEVSQLPAVILDLAPSYVTIDAEDGCVSIEMHGGMDHFGVHIYSESFKKPHPGFVYGNRILTEGLWYYDEQYNYDSEYDKTVSAMLEGALTFEVQHGE